MTNTEIEKQILQISERLNLLVTLLTKPDKPCTYTLYAWLDEWYTIYKKTKLAKNGSAEIENCIRNHIKPHLTDKPLNEVNGLDVQKVLNEVTASRTKKYTYYVFSGALNQAVKLKIINDNPMTAVESPKHRYQNGKALTLEQQQYFLEVIRDNPYRPLYEFYLLSGCRRNEATAILWTDIDYKGKRIHIPGTKTTTSDRYIPLFPSIEKIFAELPHSEPLVFATTWNAVSSHFKRLKAKYNLPFRLHDLRHTFATRCLENGISMKTIQKWLGHARLDMTSNIYTHVTTAFEREEIEKLNLNVRPLL